MINAISIDQLRRIQVIIIDGIQIKFELSVHALDDCVTQLTNRNSFVISTWDFEYKKGIFLGKIFSKALNQ